MNELKAKTMREKLLRNIEEARIKMNRADFEGSIHEQVRAMKEYLGSHQALKEFDRDAKAANEIAEKYPRKSG